MQRIKQMSAFWYYGLIIVFLCLLAGPSYGQGSTETELSLSREILAERENPLKVEALFQKRLRLFPKSDDAWVGYLRFLIQEDRFKQAVIVLSAADRFFTEESRLAEIAIFLKKIPHITTEGDLNIQKFKLFSRLASLELGRAETRLRKMQEAEAVIPPLNI